MKKIVTVNLPDIGEGVVEGEIIEWLKQTNDTLQQDEPVVIVMTDKATVELPAPHPGRLAKQYFQVGEIALRDKPLYDIETLEEISEEKKTPQESPKKELSKKPAITSNQTHKALAAPTTRKLATDLKLDINDISGTGPEGIVTKDDLAHYQRSSKQEQAIPETKQDKEIPLQGIRNLMAKKMAESKKQIPHFSYFEQLDATRLVQLRNGFKEEGTKQGISVTFMPFIVKALSLTLLRFPLVNSSLNLEKNSVTIHAHHNVGIAITTRNGLIVPVLKEVEKMSLQELIRAYDELKQRALENRLDPEDMRDGTITVSNFGVLEGGGLWATPIINHPEVAILAVAKIQKQPIVKNSELAIRDTLNLSWSFDHRIIDGELAATFSHHFSTLLQNPAPLL